MTEQVMTGTGRMPKLVAPPKSCETHSHIYGPISKYPHHSGRVHHVEASLDAYRTMLARLGFERGIIVQPSTYGRDNRATLEAIATMGQANARGVAVTAPDVSADELQRLHDGGIRGMRFFFLVDDFTIDDLAPMAAKVAPLGWHVQVQDNGSWIVDAMPYMKDLPVDVVIDHIGRTPAANGVNDPDFQALLKFMESGKCWVKISAPYLQSTDGPPLYRDVGEKVKALVSVRPDRLVWAANWPHPNSPLDNKPEEADCLDPLLEWVPDKKIRDDILATNPGILYGFDR